MELRERFQQVPVAVPEHARPGHATRGAQPLIAPGVGARFEPLASGHVQALVPAAAKRAVRRSASVELPVSADGPVRLTDDTSQAGIAFSLVGAKASPLATTSEGLALYAGAGPGGADVVHRVHAEGTEDYIVFENEPERLAARRLAPTARPQVAAIAPRAIASMACAVA
jgi:hypothetical protein